MTEHSRAMVGRTAPDFSSPGTDGALHGSASLRAAGPFVLTFTKVGCPCSVAAQPFFN
jgi:peroxiredoxin